MTLFKRSVLGVKKHPLRSGILFVTIFLLATLTSVAISMHRAVTSTDVVLRRRLPAIATVRLDNDRLQMENHMGPIDPVTPLLMRELGALPYVRAFDYVLTQMFYSENLVRFFDVQLFDVLGNRAEFATPEDWRSLAHHDVAFLEAFELRGVYHADVFDIESGLIDLVAGRTFTSEEADLGLPVALVSQSWLEANGLALNDTFSLEQRIYDTRLLHEDPSATFTDLLSVDNLLGVQAIEFEIIGVFDQDLDLRAHGDFSDVHAHIEILNRIYVPSRFNEQILAQLPEWLDETLLEALSLDFAHENLLYHGRIFLLEDPLDLPLFEEKANEMLPEFWQIDVVAQTYDDFSNAMVTMLEISTYLVVGAFVTTALVLSLVFALLLQSRSSEIGIYRALGETKARIFLQLLLEALFIVPLAVTFGLFLGHQVSNQFSTEILRQELASQAENHPRESTTWSDSPANLGFKVDLSAEELLALFDVSLDATTVVIFYASTLMVTTGALAMPIRRKLRMNLKTILMKGSIG